MKTLTEEEITFATIAAERERLAAKSRQIAGLEQQLAAVEQELKEASRERDKLTLSVQWRELMAEVNQDDAVYQVQERLMGAFATFRQSLLEPASYVKDVKTEMGEMAEVVPYSDTDDYADFSAVEAVVEEALVAVRKTLVAHSAEFPSRRGSHSWPSSPGSPSPGAAGSGGTSEPENVRGAKAKVRRQALLKLLVMTVLLGHTEEHCDFDAIRDPLDAPTSSAEELQEDVTAVWHWLFSLSAGVLTAEERTEWLGICKNYLGDAYVVAAS